MISNSYCDFQKLLDKELENPEFREGFEKEKNLYLIEVKFNELLQKIGCKGYRLELVEDNDYYSDEEA